MSVYKVVDSSMVKGCGNRCMKYCLFASNIFFLMIGLALLVSGSLMLIRARDLQDVFQTPDAAAVLVIIVGLGVSVIAFFGCCGAIQEGKCMLGTYALLVGIAFFVEVAAAVLLLVYTGQVTEYARQGMDDAVKRYNPNDPNDPTTSLVNNLQWTLKCCGAQSINDWNNRPTGSFGARLPVSCCYDPMESRECYPQNAFQQPCATALETTTKTFLGITAGFVFLVAIIQMVAACFACSLAKAS